jgi:hypothetical protein
MWVFVRLRLRTVKKFIILREKKADKNTRSSFLEMKIIRRGLPSMDGPKKLAFLEEINKRLIETLEVLVRCFTHHMIFKKWNEMTDFLKDCIEHIEIYDTICNATSERLK